MSPNFEKGIIGAVIIVSSVGGVEAQNPKNEIDNSKNVIEVSDKQKNDIIKNSISFEDAQKSLDEKNLNKIKDEKQIEEIRTELGLTSQEGKEVGPEFYRNQYLKYMEHPSYKERLAKEMYGNEVIDEEKQNKIDEEYNKRIEEIRKVPIKILPQGNENISRYSPIEKNIQTTAIAALHELSHAAEYRPDEVIDKGFSEKKMESFISTEDTLNIQIDKICKEKYFALQKIGDKEYKENHQKFIEILRKYIDNNKNNAEFKNQYNLNLINNSLNELNNSYFSLQDFYKYFNYSDQLNIIKENRDLLYSLEPYENERDKYDSKINGLINYVDYLKSNTEIKARLNSLRIKAINEYNFDLNTNFDINKLNGLKNDSQYKDLINLGLNDEGINELMKYTAMNEENGDTYYHDGWDYNNKQDQA